MRVRCHAAEQADILERPRNARLGHFMHRGRLVRLAVQYEFAGILTGVRAVLKNYS